MFDLFGNINKLRNIHSDSEKKKIAKLLQTTPEALEEFEKAYHLGVLEEPVSDNLFEVNAKQAAGMNDHITVDDSEVESLIDRIVQNYYQKQLSSNMKMVRFLMEISESRFQNIRLRKKKFYRFRNLSGHSCLGHF